MSFEPTVDEAKFNAAQKLVRATALQGTPLEGDSCNNCLYYLQPGDPLAFCWHEKFQCLVGREWWCQFWAMRED